MGKVINYKLEKVQITCPNCRYEFPYNKQALDKKIKKIGINISQIQKTINRIRQLPPEQINQKEITRLEKQRYGLENLLDNYKLERETLNECEDRLVFENLKIALREIGGDELYKLCMDRALRDSKAYTLQETMNVKDYTHNEGGNIQKFTY